MDIKITELIKYASKKYKHSIKLGRIKKILSLKD